MLKNFVSIYTQFVLHPSGGCPMADTTTKGVVNALERMFSDQTGDQVYEDLNVIDGSVVPDSIGINPSMTNSALALRAAAYIQNKE